MAAVIPEELARLGVTPDLLRLAVISRRVQNLAEDARQVDEEVHNFLLDTSLDGHGWTDDEKDAFMNDFDALVGKVLETEKAGA